jgi:multiple sugar transport system permease protein
MKSEKQTGFINMRTIPYLMVLPAMAVIAVFMFYPIFKTFYNSFHYYILTRPKDYGFIGFGNYVKLFNDPLFYKALKNTLIWTFYNVILQCSLGLLVALLMNVEFKGRKFFRMIVFSPWAFGGMLVALIFSYMFTGQTGVINDLLIKAGIIDHRISWFATGTLARATLIFTTTWRGIPFFAISFLAALQSIPGDYYEAADVDGASSFYQFRKITLPLIKNTIILTTMLRTIWTFNIVDIIAGMTDGGPNNSTMTLPHYLMTKFNEGLDIGYSSTMAAVMALILAVFAVAYVIVGGFGKEGDL